MDDGDFANLRFDRRGPVLVVTIDRPGNELNAVDEGLHHDLSRLFSHLHGERDARVVLLTGAGTAFCAGGDFAWLATLATSGQLEELRRAARQMIWDLLDVQLPIVCALNGSAAGLGASLALLCDTIFMAESASIADPHVAVGLVAGDGGTIAWPLAVGPARAKRHLLTGDPLSASDAASLGLVTDVVPDGEVFDRAFEFCERLAARAPLAVQYTKMAVNAWVKEVAAASFDLAGSLEILTFGSDDHAEAMRAIAERRPPRYGGR